MKNEFYDQAWFIQEVRDSFGIKALFFRTSIRVGLYCYLKKLTQAAQILWSAGLRHAGPRFATQFSDRADALFGVAVLRLTEPRSFGCGFATLGLGAFVVNSLLPESA